MFLDMFIVKSLLCTKDRSNLKSLTLAVNWWCEAFLPYSFNYILYVFSCCFNSCYLPSLLQMLSSKDVNFMGYTYKNFEIVNDHEVPGISNLSCPFYIFIIFVHNISYGHLKYPYGIYFCFCSTTIFMLMNVLVFFSWIKEEKQQTKETHCQIPLQYDFLFSMLLSYILGAYMCLSVADIIV